MIKRFVVGATFNNMRLDRFLRNKIGKIPQGLIEKKLRTGKIKLNKKKVKSSTKVTLNDKVELFNLDFREKSSDKKINFKPSNTIIKSNEKSIIENNEDFIVINKDSGISVQGGTKSKKNLISQLQDKKSANKVTKTLSKRYEKRSGGYTRIIKAGFRYGDNAPMAIIEFVDRDVEAKRVDKKKKGQSEITENKDSKKESVSK